MKTINKIDKFILEGTIIGWEYKSSLQGRDSDEYTVTLREKFSDRRFQLPVNKDFVSEYSKSDKINIIMEIKVLDNND